MSHTRVMQRIASGATVAAAACLAACGGGDVTDVAALSEQIAEDADHPTPAPQPPTLPEGCPDGRGASPRAAAEALAGTPAWATLDPQRLDDFATVAGRADGALTGTVVGVEQGERSPSALIPHMRAAGLELADEGETWVRLTVNLIVDVETAEGLPGDAVVPGDTVAVPLVVFDGSVTGLPDDQVETMHANLSRQIDCAVPRSRVALVGTLGRGSPDGIRPAVVALPALDWLPDPAAVAFESEMGVESLDVLVTDDVTGYFAGATTLDEVASSGAAAAVR